MPAKTPVGLDRLSISRTGVMLSGEVRGVGRAAPSLVLLHGLTATRRYVLMGSRYLERSGFRVVAYDARGHGESSPAPDPARYEYVDLVADLDAVVDAVGDERVVLVGNSMGAATAIACTLAHPERVAALVQVTPAYAGHPYEDERELAGWDALADGLERGGVDGFLEAYDPGVGGRFGEAALAFTRQRLGRHRHPEAVAAALRVVPRSRAFDGLDALHRIEAPTLVVGSRDEADPAHPLAVAEAYSEHLPRSRLVVEPPGEAPLAWRGAELSREIERFLRVHSS
jgi:pimeloyl-ACP methyl ester carboxylesterase